MRVLHGISAIFIFTLLIVGSYMVDLPISPEKTQIYNMHKSFGLIALLIFTIRIIVRCYSHLPTLPDGIKSFEVKLSKIVTFMLYSCMIIMPLSGYIMNSAGSHDINFINSGHIVPNLIDPDPAIGSFAWHTHGYTAFIFELIIALHIVGAIKHLLVERINVFKRMI
jgi:cytochrome b561